MNQPFRRCSPAVSQTERATALGIDAAWSPSRASGYALIERLGKRCKLLACGANLEDFRISCCADPHGGAVAGIDADRALAYASQILGGEHPQVVAADLPLSRKEIRSRRASDDSIARCFGEAGCGTHSPNADRPGVTGRCFQDALETAGYRLATHGDTVATGSLIEVYPHPAFLRLMQVRRRLPYKVSKTTRYWPGTTVQERVILVKDQLRFLAKRLDGKVAGTVEALTSLIKPQETLTGLKGAEDLLDAIVSAWVGMAALEGHAEAFGDEDSAIWVPSAEAVMT